MKKWILILFLFSSALVAQNTVINMTVVDSDGTTWVKGTWKITFVPNSAIQNLSLYNINGVPLTQSVMNQSGALDNSGIAAITVYDNSLITPIGSSWSLTVCPNASSACGIYNLTASGTSIDISSALTFIIPPPRFLAIAGSYGYNSTEALLQKVPGSTYYDVTNNCQNYYNTATFSWACPGGGGGIGTVTNFNAPSINWPSWLTPTVINPTSTPSLNVAASSIPNSALSNSSTSVNGVACTLGSSCSITVPTSTSYPQKVYYLAPSSLGGSDSNIGSFASPWLSPNHSLNCGDTIYAIPSTSYVAANFNTGKWGTVTCPNSNAVAWLQCMVFDGCKINAGATAPMIVSASFWGVQGFENTNTSGSSGSCFAAQPPTTLTNIHHIIFANNIANGCGGNGITGYNNGTASFDYLVIVGNIIYNSGQNNVHCFSGISIYQPVPTDTAQGTHIYVAGNFSYGNVNPNPCDGTSPTNATGINLDTLDGHATINPTNIIYTQQVAVDNNISVGNYGYGLEYQTYTKGTPSHPTVYFVNNTSWGNQLNPSCTYNTVSEAFINIGYGLFFNNNILMSKTATACGFTFYTMNIYDASNTNTAVINNLVYSATASNFFAFNDDSNTAPSTTNNITGTNPSFAAPATPSSPACAGTLNVRACMNSVVSNFTTSASAAVGLGYQDPTISPKPTNPLFPQWICKIGIPDGIINKPCL